MTYDCTQDTQEHIGMVRKYIAEFMLSLRARSKDHDASKLESPEKEAFDLLTPRLKGLTYGSDEYRACLRKMKPAIQHHYAHNTHHPEHYKFWKCPICESVFSENDAPPSVYDGPDGAYRLCPNCCANGTIMEAALEPTTGVYGMDLLDVVEMLCDWKAAGMRHADGDILKSLEINRKRFELSDQLYKIMVNTVMGMGWALLPAAQPHMQATSGDEPPVSDNQTKEMKHSKESL